MTTAISEFPVKEINCNSTYLEIYGIDHLYRMQEIARKKIRKLIWKEHNQRILEEIGKKVDKGLSIAANAYEKLETIVSEYGKLISNTGNAPQELALYLLSDKQDVIQQHPVVNDVYIAHEQNVWPNYCQIEAIGAVKSCRDIRDNLDKRVIGHSHSHGTNFNSFSPRDRRTIDTFLEDHKLFGLLKINHYDHSHTYDIEYTYGLVVNQRKDKPFACLNISYPEYHVDDDDNVSVVMKTKRFDDIKLKLLSTNHYNPSSDGIKRIKEELISRVILAEKEKRLSDYFEKDGSTIEPNAPGLDKKVIFKENRQHDKKKDQTLAHRVAELESNYKVLENKYNDLLRQTKYLKGRLDSFEGKEPSTRYFSHGIKDYYSGLISSKNLGENLLGRISKILAGDYYSNLNLVSQGNLQEDKSYGRIWKWEDRIKAVTEIIENNNNLFSNTTENTKEELIKILKENRYLRKKHTSKYQRIRRILKKSKKNH